ncbi:hypothetical protein K1719_008266 [Acacia pycnantha]|nr:hypothetical protein K1719_008266 [Acacia pycnantha]
MESQKLIDHHHFVVIPLMVPSHLLPIVDIAKLLACRNNVKVTLATTPLNAARVQATIDREIHHQSGGSSSSLQIQLFQFPNAESGVPEGCESFDALPSTDLLPNFYKALSLLQNPLEELFEKLSPIPTCVIYDKNIPSASDVAKKFQVPSIIFDGTSCFNLLCTHCLRTSKAYENVSDSESFIVPGLPGKISFKKHQLHYSFSSSTNPGMSGFREKVLESEEEAYGVIVNSFEELEDEYVKEYKRVTGRNVWCVGPVSLSNKDDMDKAQRGRKGSNKEAEEEGGGGKYLKWLDSWPARSVIYVCLGSLSRVDPEQLMELGLGLEASKRPFIWVLRDSHKREEMDKLLKEDGLEDRLKGRGLITRNWVPQILILSHTAIGAFLTHCGWNSTIEGISNGVPLITFPMFSEQFYNEKEGEVQVKKEKVKEAIEKVMSEEDEESERIRERGKEFGEKANKAMEKEGSSSLNMSLLIEDIAHVMRLR